MTLIKAWSPEEIAAREEVFVGMVAASMTFVAHKVAMMDDTVVVAAAAPPPAVPLALSDLAVTNTLWAQQVNAELAPYVITTYQESASALAANMALAGFVVPAVSDSFAEDFLAGAVNRLVGIGDLLWENARSELLIGFELGESIPKLRDRVMAAVGVTEARANVIARTEIIAASNMGAFQQVLISGLVGEKTWLDTDDKRTRPTHKAAGGQTVDIREPFIVGGANLMAPGDPGGPVEEIVQCRCSVDFDLHEADDSGVLIAAAEVHTGAMIALRMTEADARCLEVPGFEDADQLHTTIMYLGDAVDFDEDARWLVHNVVESIATSTNVITTDAFSVNAFNPHTTERDTAVVLGLRGGDTGIVELHAAITGAIESMLSTPQQHKPWVPHVTLAYTDDLSILPRLVDRCGPLQLSAIRVAFGDEVTDYPLRGIGSLYANLDMGGGTVPWRIAENSASCTSNEPYAVVKDGTGEVEGCHATRAAAQEQLRALYASEGSSAQTTAEAQIDCPEGEHRMPDGRCMKDEDMPSGTTYKTQGWEGPLVVEGIETGDGRMFAEGSLTWPDLPVPLMYQRVTSHGGMTDESVNVGRIDEIWRDGNVIMGRGVLDMEDPNAVVARRKIAGKYLRGVSIDADSVKDADVEFIFPEGAPDDNGDPMPDELAQLFGVNPELTIFHRGRIRATTLVNVPAFVEAYITLIGDEPLVASLAPRIEVAAREPEVLTAASHTITIPDVPDESWFQEPDELPPIGAIWVTDEGRIFGCVGPSNVPHRAFARKVTIPMGNVDYTAWMNRPTIVTGGKRIATGLITMDCGHMSPYASEDPGIRMMHYDNSCSAAAVVCIGESRRLGVPWVAGALLPMDAERLQRFMACQLSGDWAPHRERHGWKEFVAALTVPVPGFARKTNVASVRVVDGVIVASATPFRRYVKQEVPVESTVPTDDEGSFRMRLGGIRARLSQGNRAQLATIRDRVRTTANPVRAKATPRTDDKKGVKMSGCKPCDAAKAAREAAATHVPAVSGYGDGDGEAAATQSVNNAIANASANQSRVKKG